MRRKIQGRSFFSQKKTWGRRLRSYLLVLIGALGFFYGGIFLWPVVPSQTNTQEALLYKVKISPQSSLGSIAQQLQEQGLSTPMLPFQVSARA